MQICILVIEDKKWDNERGEGKKEKEEKEKVEKKKEEEEEGGKALRHLNRISCSIFRARQPVGIAEFEPAVQTPRKPILRK